MARTRLSSYTVSIIVDRGPGKDLDDVRGVKGLHRKSEG